MSSSKIKVEVRKTIEVFFLHRPFPMPTHTRLHTYHRLVCAPLSYGVLGAFLPFICRVCRSKMHFLLDNFLEWKSLLARS